ncbi:hypothetical protein BsWGS_16391 [Bradybaena similaris]
MNNESKDDKIVKHGINNDNDVVVGSPVDNTGVREGNTSPDSVSKDKAGGSKTVNTSMFTMGFSMASGTPPLASNSQACDSFSPTSSSFHDPGPLSRYNEAAVAGPSAAPDYYSALKLLGINKRKKPFTPTQADKDSEVKNTAAGLDPHTNNQAMPRLELLVDWEEDDKDVESSVENRCLITNSTSSDINSTCLTPVEKQQPELENTQSYSSAIPSPEVATIVAHSKLKLEKALNQIVEEKSVNHTNQQQGRPGSSESQPLDIPSLEHSQDDGNLKNIDGKIPCSHTDSRHSILKISKEEEALKNDEITQKASDFTSSKSAEQSLTSVYRKKSVHFADSDGLDLVSIRLVDNTNSPPNVPQSVLDALWLDMEGGQKEPSLTFLYPCFEQPGADFNFFRKVLQQQICLENVLVSEMTINGYIRVAKTPQYPSVVVRYSVDNWSTFNEIYATHIFATPDGKTERYSFVIDALPHMEPGSFLELVLVMTANTIEYYDSNEGHNYRLECVNKISPSPW